LKRKKLINLTRIVTVFYILALCLVFSGCSQIDKAEVKYGLKNNDFEYIKQGKIKQIVIQNTRDEGFRFVIKDSKAISDLYDILSTAKPVTNKSSLEPDYTIEMQESSTVTYKFNYIAGLDKTLSGNLYSNDKIYIVSSRIDNDIIQTFWNTKIPNNFKYIYYDSITEVLKKYLTDTKTDKKIGVDLTDDIDAAKFIMSTQLEDFNSNLYSTYNNAEIVKPNKDYDIILSVVTQAYTNTVYKSIVTFTNRIDNSEQIYYISDVYNDSSWNVTVSSKKPDGF
jgi:hypothetical protein